MICPVCKNEFRKLLRGKTCPSCYSPLHDFKANGKKYFITDEEMSEIPRILETFQQLVSEKQGKTFRINHRDLNQETRACQIIFARLRELLDDMGYDNDAGIIKLFYTFMDVLFLDTSFNFLSNSIFSLHSANNRIFPQIAFKAIDLQQQKAKREATEKQIAEAIQNTTIEVNYAL